ncbi:MAG TPA: hypothetical protein VL574_08495 [Stellaceae bacterium]|jgi:hypothetical protein|nr:hypothetical protein [Stellaceae bacterium]
MKRILTATAAVALMAASPLAFAADNTTGAATANPSAPATPAQPDAGTSNPAMAPNGPTSQPSQVNGETSQQDVTPPSRTSTSGNRDQEPAKVGAGDTGQDQSGAASEGNASPGSAAPKHHHARHVGAKKRGGSASDERDITAALNVLSSNGYTNPQNLQATSGHKVSATATKEGQSVNVVVDPAAGTVSQQNS